MCAFYNGRMLVENDGSEVGFYAAGQPQSGMVNMQCGGTNEAVNWKRDTGYTVTGIGQIKCLINGKTNVGSGNNMTWAKDGKKIWLVSTCAHNFKLKKVGRNGFYEADSCIFVHQRDANKSYCAKKIDRYYVHEKFNGDPACGYDYAIGIVSHEGK